MNWGQKLVASGADGASVNLGKKAGLAALLRKELSFLVDFHCLPHRLELALLEVQKSCKSHDDVYNVLKGPQTDFSRLAKEVKCYFLSLTSSYHELTRKPTHKQNSPHKLLFPSKVFPCPSSRSFSDQLRMRKRTEFRLEKKAKFLAVLN